MIDDLARQLRGIGMPVCNQAAAALEAKDREIERLTHERNAACSQLQVHLHNAEVARDEEVERLRSIAQEAAYAATQHQAEVLLMRVEIESLKRDAERAQWMQQWLRDHGLLHYHDLCTRPDRTHGPAWVLRRPYAVDGDSCLAWGMTPDAAIDAAMSQQERA